MPLFGSTITSHAQLSSVTANQHHNEDHSARHDIGGSDELDAVYWHKYVLKSGNQVVNNSSTLVNDTSLKIAIAANEKWLIRFALSLTGQATSDFKAGVTVPAGASLLGMSISGNDDAAPAGVFNHDAFSVSGDYAAMQNPTGTTNIYTLEVVVENGANAGDVQLQWAQATAQAHDTTVYVRSFAIAHRVS